MKRVLTVMLIGTLSTLLLGVEDTSWAVQASVANPAGLQGDPIMQALSTLRRGATVEIERSNGTKFYAVIEEIAPDTVTVMRDQAGKTLTETIAVADIRSIKAVSVRQVAHGHKGLIAAAVVVGLLIVALGACAAANQDVRPVPSGV